MLLIYGGIITFIVIQVSIIEIVISVSIVLGLFFIFMPGIFILLAKSMFKATFFEVPENY